MEVKVKMINKVNKVSKVLGLFALVLAFALTGSAQTRILAGVGGGPSYDNAELGFIGQVELPIKERVELSLREAYYPLEIHTGLGSGTANLTRVGGIVWLTKSFGVTASTEYSTYHVTKVEKGGFYTYGGPIFKTNILDVPVRVEIDYVRQVRNGITTDGIETSHLQGAALSFDGRVGCAGAVCFRLYEQFSLGRVYTQGNPICDGSFPLTTLPSCPRSSALGSSFTTSFMIEFPRRKDSGNRTF